MEFDHLPVIYPIDLWRVQCVHFNYSHNCMYVYMCFDDSKEDICGYLRVTNQFKFPVALVMFHYNTFGRARRYFIYKIYIKVDRSTELLRVKIYRDERY